MCKIARFREFVRLHGQIHGQGTGFCCFAVLHHSRSDRRALCGGLHCRASSSQRAEVAGRSILNQKQRAWGSVITD